jgi:peroxiredoxin
LQVVEDGHGAGSKRAGAVSAQNKTYAAFGKYRKETSFRKNGLRVGSARVLPLDRSGGTRRSIKHPTQHPSLMPLAIGAKAPDFTLKSKTADGLKDIKLSDAFGQQQTVLLFFPLAFTGVCTEEMCDMSAGLGDYEQLGAKVIAISVDSPFAQEAWAKANGIKVTLASDLNKEVTKAYDVVFPMLAGVGDTAARAAFVIGKDGVIKYAEQTPTPKQLPDFAAVKAALSK